MRTRIRRLTRTRSGKPMVHESQLVVDVLSIGRGTDNDLQLDGLMVPLHHAALAQRADGFWVEPREPRPLAVNGGLVQGASRFRPGDVLGVGPHEIRMLPAADEDVLLEVERVKDERPATDALRGRISIGVERGLFTRRKLSWAAVAAVVVFGAALPLAATRRRPKELLPMPAAALSWMPGPVSRVHSFTGAACATCHAVPFAPVRDRECQACHRTTGRHVAPDRPEPALFATTRCASCHPEHRGGAHLVGNADGVCTRCHADLKRQVADTRLDDVSRFAADGGHPEFRIVAPVAPDSPACERLAIAGSAPAGSDAPRDDALLARTGLRFSHALHLTEGLRAKWVGPAERAAVTLGCADCHVPDAAGALFLPVAFRDHCQRCHDLRFADGSPDRQVTHPAEPAAVAEELFQFYAARALADERSGTGAEPVRRRPGAVLAEAERLDALAWARHAAAQAADDLLGRRGVDAGAGNRGACAVCHAFTADGARVLPIRAGVRCGADPTGRAPIPGRWLERTAFRHASHRATPCADCHRPEQAAASPTGMLPGRAACVGCHARGAAGTRRTLDRCVQCHAMHVERYGPMRVEGASAAAERAQRAREARRLVRPHARRRREELADGGIAGERLLAVQTR